MKAQTQAIPEILPPKPVELERLEAIQEAWPKIIALDQAGLVNLDHYESTRNLLGVHTDSDCGTHRCAYGWLMQPGFCRISSELRAFASLNRRRWVVSDDVETYLGVNDEGLCKLFGDRDYGDLHARYGILCELISRKTAEWLK